MLYRVAGQYKTSYKADMSVFPLLQDRIGIAAILIFAFVGFPMTANHYMFLEHRVPVLIYELDALGLNILTGYAGQLSLGTGAFMGVGAYACYKLVTIFPEMNLVVTILLSGIPAAIVGVAFGLPSLRIKGFYLAIATLAAQFFLVWLFQKWGWLYNYNTSGAIQVPNIGFLGINFAGPNASAVAQYYFVLCIVTLVTIVAINLTRGRIGRMWKAVRDMDIAAELVGINLMKAKLMAFLVSSYIVGVSGALFVFLWRGAAEAELFDVQLSFRVLFIAIIGGLGSILGNYLGAILIVALPVLISAVPRWFGLPISSAMVEHLNIMIVGALIIAFLILEPHGLARYWQIIREKLIIWPFPH